MAARGTESKEFITQKILETFEGSFKYDKEIRIPVLENGETVQIKVTLTAAKVNVENGGGVAVPTAAASATPTFTSDITDQEKQVVADLLASLNL